MNDFSFKNAFLNYLLFDESMQVVPEESGAIQVQQANAWSDLSKPLFEINRNGFIYVYSINASGISVRTDNLFVAHYQGSLLEEFHYYPFGLCFDVSKSPLLIATAEQKYNSQFIQQDEFTDANGQTYGLEDYDFAFRNYDPQIGRWLQPDPLMQHASPYLAMSNNPVLFTDPTGLYDGQQDWIGINENGEIVARGAAPGEHQYTLMGNFENGTCYVISKEDFDKYRAKYFSREYSKFGSYLIFDGSPVIKKEGEAYGIYNYKEITSNWTNSQKKENEKSAKIVDAVNTTLNAFGFSSGTKDMIIEDGAAMNRKINIYKVNETSILRTYGATGAKYLKYSKGLGIVGSVVTTGFALGKTIDQINSGGPKEVMKNRDVLDATVGLTGLGFAAYGIFVTSNPIGWGVGAAVLIYGGGTLIWDASHQKK